MCVCMYVSKKYINTHIHVYGVFVCACEWGCYMYLQKCPDHSSRYFLFNHSLIHLVFLQHREDKRTFFNVVSSLHSLTLWISSAVTSVMLTYHPETALVDSNLTTSQLGQVFCYAGEDKEIDH